MPTVSSHRETWLLYGGAALIVVIAFLVTYQFVSPAPPTHFRIATGSSGNAYYQYAQAYAQRLRADGIDVEVLETEGSLSNLALLANSQADVAFVQGGVIGSSKPPSLRSLASLYFEPLWVFVPTQSTIERLSALKGLRLAIGPEGSGTRALALTLLSANGVDAENSTLLPTAGEQAIEALDRGELDALFLVTAPSSPLLRKLISLERVQLVSLSRAEAYQRQFEFLSALEIPEGAIDLAANLPPDSIKLVAPAATLVTKEDFHPALITLLLQAATEIHGPRNLLAGRNNFPSADYLEVPIHEEAARYLELGTPFLQRFLPFWAANLIDRLMVMLLPLVTLAIPLMKLLPPTYRWRVRSRIYRWYDQLRDLDFQVDAAEDAAGVDILIRALNEIEQDVMQVTVPQSYADAQYNLRLHIRLIRERLDRKRPPKTP